jgi:hypothetical protein
MIDRGTANDERIWLSPGTGQTSFNAYIQSSAFGKEAIVVAAYKDGRLWSALNEIPLPLVRRLSTALSDIGISLNTKSQYPYWRKGGSAVVLTQTNARLIGEAVVQAVYG